MSLVFLLSVLAIATACVVAVLVSIFTVAVVGIVAVVDNILDMYEEDPGENEICQDV